MPDRILTIQQDHRRSFADNRHVYAVVSRRSKGVSIGINLNPDKICIVNFPPSKAPQRMNDSALYPGTMMGGMPRSPQPY